MSSNKNESFFDNKVFQAALIVSIVLVSSAFFISQTDNMFGKAAGQNITGTLILHDYELYGDTTWASSFSLPGTSCETKIVLSGFFGHTAQGAQGCWWTGSNAWIKFDGVVQPITLGTVTNVIDVSIPGGIHQIETRLGWMPSGTCAYIYGKLTSVSVAYSCIP